MPRSGLNLCCRFAPFEEEALLEGVTMQRRRVMMKERHDDGQGQGKNRDEVWQQI